MWTRRTRLFRRRKCPHVHLQALYGEVRDRMKHPLQCTDCWALLDGITYLAYVNRDPADLVPHQDDWYQGKELGHVQTP